MGNLSFLDSIIIEPVDVVARTVKLALVKFSVFDGLVISYATHSDPRTSVPETIRPTVGVSALGEAVPEFEPPEPELPDSDVHEQSDSNALSDGKIVT
jgi:hypothetical protein